MDEIKEYPPYLNYPKPYKAQTNADRIRAMSDEELADVLREFATKPMQGSFLKWLQQQTEEDER